MAGVIGTGNHPKALWPGIHAWWGRTYEQHTEEYSQIFNVEGSTKAYEEDVEVTGFGLPAVKAQAAPVSYDSETQGDTTRYTNVAYALGYITTREEMDDCQYEVVGKRRSEALAFSMRQGKEIVHANILNKAFTTTDTFAGGDGVQLISTAHLTKTGTQSNRMAIDADLSEASLESLTIQMMQARNSRGLQFALMPKDLIIPVNLWYDATRILRSTLQSGTANNDVNALKFTGAIPGGIVMNHYLTDTDAFFLSTNVPRGLTSFQRIGIEFTQDNDFDTENAKAKCYERYVPGWTDWRCLFGSSGV